MGRSLGISRITRTQFDPSFLSDRGQELPFKVEQRAELEVKIDFPAGQAGVTDKLQRAMLILRLRQARQSIFGPGLFGEPAWDMFLQLYASTLSGKKECVSSLCVASGVPYTTALRWIRLLERSGWVERYADPFDRRRTFMIPSQKVLDAMDRFFCHPYFGLRI